MNGNNTNKLTDQGIYYSVESENFNEDIKVYVCRKGVLEHNLIYLYYLIWGHCSLYIQAELVIIDGIKENHDTQDRVCILDQAKIL